MKDENGMLITESKEKEIWGNHFNKILSRPCPEEPISIPKTSWVLLDITTEPPTEDEILKAVKKLKNSRSYHSRNSL